MRLRRYCFALLLVASVCAVGQELPAVTPYRATSFQTTTKYLNPGGSFFLYMDSEQWAGKIDEVMGKVAELVMEMAPEGEEQQMADLVFHFLESFLTECGLRQLHGIGLSSIAEAEGIYHNRMVLAHATPGPPKGLYWETFTGDNGPLNLIDWFPQDTVLASQSPFHAAPIWSWLKRTVSSSGYEPLEAGFAQNIMMAEQMGVNVDQWIDSMAGTVALVATVSRDEVFQMPLPTGGTLVVPQMAAALLVEVKDDTMFQFYDTMLRMVPNLARFDAGDMQLRSVPVPVPVPIRFLPTVGRIGPYLVFATNDDIVKSLDACRRGERPSLRADEEFQLFARDMPENGMAFSFLSRRLSEAIHGLTRQMGGDDEGAAEIMNLMQDLQKEHASYAVSLRMSDAMVATGRANFDMGEALVLQAAVLPVAVMSGMMLPALAQARSKARAVSDMSNLKQIGLGLFMYADDHNDQYPQSLADIWPYVGTGSVFVTPGSNTPVPQNADEVRAGQCDYLYFLAGRRFADMQDAHTVPAACTKPGLLKQGVNVLYADGHVESKLVIDDELQVLIDGAR